MPLPGLLKRLGKELERGGKKTVVLGVLLVGGMYFWIPMLGKALFPNRRAPTPKARSVAAAATGNAPATVKPNGTTPSVEWQILYQRLQSAQAIQPLALDELVRDPFDQSWIREKTAPPSVAKSESAPAVANPLDSMAVSAILVGTDGGSAIINDVVYRRDDYVPRQGPVRYVLKAIFSDRVVLELEGSTFELKVANRAPGRLEQ